MADEQVPANAVAEADVALLLAGLAALHEACDAEDWELAYTLMHEHDCRLRAVLAERPTRALQAVLRAQHAIISEMTARRTATAMRLAELRRGAHAVGTYCEGGVASP